MPNWDGIEDASFSPPRIWLCRERDNEPWCPLRKFDCRALNASSPPGSTVRIECGRSNADTSSMTVRYAFYNGPTRSLARSAWFWREDRGSKEGGAVLHPLPEADGDKVEDLYQRVLVASSSLGEGVDEVIKEEIPLVGYDPKERDGFKAVVSRSAGGTLSMKRRSVSFFGPSYPLQRGYGPYKVEGEEEEMALGPVRHLIFAVHGVGEAMWSRDDVSVASMISQMNHTRSVMHRRQVEEWRRECERSKQRKEETPPPPNRIEILPIEWYERIHSASSTLKRTLISTTLRSVPKFRAIANDVVFDVLMYLTPEFCEEVLDCVTSQIIDLHGKFIDAFPTFVEDGGKFSLAGHSLGSVIVWDMLTILQQNLGGTVKAERDEPLSVVPLRDMFGFSLKRATSDSKVQEPRGYQAYAMEGGDENAEDSGTWGPALPKRMTGVIPFVPEFTLFLGSPLGLFLSLRGAHPVFDRMRKRANVSTQRRKSQSSTRSGDGEVESKVAADLWMLIDKEDEAVTSPFCLPTGACYNVFHPNDPVAYRIEPLLLPQRTPDGDLPPPAFLTAGERGVRLHVKARDILRGMSGIWGGGLDRAVAAATEYVGGDDVIATIPLGERVKAGQIKFALGGRSDRVDFQLQPAIVENEYLSAITAHSSYFNHEDLIDFIIDKAGGAPRKVVSPTKDAAKG